MWPGFYFGKIIPLPKDNQAYDKEERGEINTSLTNCGLEDRVEEIF